MTPDRTLTADQAAALDVARDLARSGIPLFLAQPDASVKTGFKPPYRWQQTAVADPAVADAWRPGLALCAVMGHGLDLIDVDPRGGGDIASLNGTTPVVHGVAQTPSGGQHLFVASTGTGSRDAFAPGLDFKGGERDGTGHGFAFLAPTVRASVVTGELSAYRWSQVPGRIPAPGEDLSGAALAARIRALREQSNSVRRLGGPQWWAAFITDGEPQSLPAADKAIDQKLAEVANWTAESGDGFRTVLLRAALTLGGYVGGEHLDETEARTRLEEAVAAVWGAPDDDDRRWIQQGLDDGTVLPFRVFTPEQERQFSEPAMAVAGEGETEPGQEAPGADGPADPPWNVFGVLRPEEPFDPTGDGSDQGLAKAVAYRMYPALRYGGDAGVWVKRSRDVWTEHGDDLSDWIVSALAELMPLGQTPIPKDLTERTEVHWQAARRAVFMSSAGAGRIARKLRALVRSDHPATVEVAELDSNPDIMWAGGVPWDLRACGEMPTPAGWIDLNTPHLRSAAVAPDPTVATPRWDAFTAAVLPDPQVRAWTLRVLAVAMTGHADAVLPVLYGRERSGKTSLIEMLVQVLGSYAHAANPKLLSSGDTSHDAIVYDLKGRRLAFIDEGPKRGHDATERLKQLTGGGSLTARPMRANPITFRPTHTLVMTTNTEPALTDPALRARVRLIPCDTAEGDVRPARVALLGSGLRTEAPGILAAMMREAAAYLADRDSAGQAAAPASISGMAEEMAHGQDPVREWIENATVPADPGTPGRELYTAFATWHQNHPLHRRMAVPSNTAFGRVLTDAGYPPAQRGKHWFRPLSVLGGPAGVAPWEPLPSAHMAREGHTPDAGYAGSTRVVRGFEGQPATADQYRSGPVSGGSLAGYAGFSLVPDTTSTSGVSTDSAGNADQNPRPAEVVGQTAPDQCRSATRVSSENPRPTRDEPATEAEGPGEGDGGSETDDQSQSVTKEGERAREAREAARLADEAQISKAQARARLKAEKIAAAVAQAAGPEYPLPVAIDRAGTVVPLDLALAARVIADATARSGALTVDVETSGYPVGHELFALRLVQLGDDAAAVVLDPDDPDQVTIAREALAAAPVLHAHSATADLVPTALAGMLTGGGIDADGYEDAFRRMVDTALVGKLADPAHAGDAPGLKDTAATVLGEHAVSPAADLARAELFKAGRWLKSTDAATPVERSGWAQVPRTSTTFLRYAASDVLDTAAIARTLPRPDDAVLARERTAARMTARVTHRGVRLDPDHIATMTAAAREGQADAEARVRAFGIDNPGSAQQVAAVFDTLGVALPRTKPSKTFPGGKPSVSVDVLKPLRDQDGDAGRLAVAVLDYRHHQTVQGLFLTPYRELCERGDGRARPTIYTLGTDTGRMSATRPNIQQLSRSGGVRACITADPGQLMIGADFSSVELRVAAALSQDPTLLRFIAEGRDIHAEVARKVWGPDATKAHRYTAKRIVFGRIYGGGIATLAAQAGVSQQVAQAAVDALDALTPGLTEWSASIRRAVQAGHTRYPTYSGRVIHLPRDYPHKGPNYCIQGTARELLVDTLLRWESTPWADATLFPVHDELDLFVPEDQAADATAALVTCMETELFGVPIVAEASEPAFAWPDSE